MKDEPTATPMVTDDYLILPCPGCGKMVKIATDSLGVRMGCTYCREPLEVTEYQPAAEEDAGGEQDEQAKDEKRATEAGGEPEISGETKPRERKPLAFRLLRDEDLGVDFNRQFADEYERRRLPTDAPEWDDEKLLKKRRERDESMAAEGADAPVRQLLTRKEHIFRTITIIIMSASAVVAAVIVYIGIVKMTSVAKTDGETLRELPAEVQSKIAAALGEQRDQQISAYLTSKEEEAAVAIITGFLKVKSNEERLAFVRDPERVAPLMEDYYSRDVQTEWPDGQVVLRDKVIDQGRYFIRLAIEFIGIGHRIFVVEQTTDSLKLDWETAVGYQPMPFSEFREKRPAEPTPFRVKMKLSDYYNYHFADSGAYLAVALSYPGNDEFKLTGYIDRGREWAPALIETLESGVGPSVIAELSFPEGAESGEGDPQVEIISIVSETWWL